MKFLLIFLLPSFAIACPMLGGKWNCVDSYLRKSELTVMQVQTASGVTAYELFGSLDETSAYYQADGIQYPLGVDGLRGTVKATCTSSNEVQILRRISYPYYSESNFTYALIDATHMKSFTHSEGDSGVTNISEMCEKVSQ